MYPRLKILRYHLIYHFTGLLLVIVLTGCSHGSGILEDCTSNVEAEFDPAKITEANRQLLQFPKNLPKVKTIRKFLTPGAAFTLVHILADHQREDMPQEYYPVLEAVQGEIYQALAYLAAQCGLGKIYVEGEQAAADGRRKMLLLFLDKKEVLKQYRYNAAERLFLEKKLELVFLDNAKENAQADAIVRGDPLWYENEENLRLVFEDREDRAMEKMALAKDPLKVFIYGGNHIFGGSQSFGKAYFQGRSGISIKDNIHHWNAAHPQKKISLIEIVVDSYGQ